MKENVLRILNEKYGLEEADFLSAELSLVPAFNARDIGFDRALIGAYGHDDRVCSYPAFTALFDEDSENRTVMVVLADKEEIGSEGTTGMQCALFTDLVDEIARAFGVSSAYIRSKSKCLSADVNAAYDPNYAEVSLVSGVPSYTFVASSAVRVILRFTTSRVPLTRVIS